MKKIKLIKCLLVVFGISSLIIPKFTNAFTFETVCQPQLTTFSDGNSTFDISFPAGGGTTCSTIAECPKIKLPANGTVFSVKVDMELVDPSSEIGTPYLWVPVSVANGYIAQIDTRDGFEAEIARYKVGNNPSRTFIVPGGDIWVANRNSGNVTKLSPLTGNQLAGGSCGDGFCGTDETIYSCSTDCNGNVCGDGTGICKNNIACGTGTENCKEYKTVGNYPTGSGPRGVTGDINGNIWVGNNGDGNIVKLDPESGVILQTVAVGGGPYGLIADQFGYVWVSNRGTSSVQAVDINTGLITQNIPTAGPYGIGIQKNGDILLASLEGASAYTINGYGTGSPGTIKAGFPVSLSGGASTRGRGIASDLNGNIWVGSDNGGSGTVYSFKSDGTQYCPFYNPSPQHNTVGPAVDFDNNIWVVPYDGNVLKLRPDNVSACTVVTPVATVFVGGGLLYNYSDMTGLRTIPKSLLINGTSISLSSSGTFEICTDGTGTCTNAAPCAAVTAFLSACTADVAGNCEIPLEIFSVQAGKYTLKNLEVIYGKQIPVTTGGLIPCGRDWDDPATTWDDTESCEVCHGVLLMNQGMNFLIQLAGVVAVLSLIVVGFLYITSVGDPERKNLAKTSFKWVIIGFIIIFLSWLIVDFILVAWGYLDPLGGKWNVICD
ncbi:MAG: hypothetical protein KAS01_00580 [Candidatus Pacebacteria bacterium]|nr:hypothetical protein [Candidatus Paceibacterota bacterium]